MFVHGDNIKQKINKPKAKYEDEISRQYLSEIETKYLIWKRKNLKLLGPYSSMDDSTSERIIKRRVALYNSYKDFIDQQQYAELFDSRSNLHSSVLEEFMFYLFKDIAREGNNAALVGKAHAFKDFFFNPLNYSDMLNKPNIKVEKKDHDFIIGSQIRAVLSVEGSEEKEKEIWNIPAVAIECKTYIDKTMLEASSTAAEQLKVKNPDALYLIVSEKVKLTDKINFKKYKVDQIFILRKEKNIDRENTFNGHYIRKPVYPDVVYKLFLEVKNHLTTDWEGQFSDGLERGYLINK